MHISEIGTIIIIIIIIIIVCLMSVCLSVCQMFYPPYLPVVCSYMYNRVMYACAHLALKTRYVFCVEIPMIHINQHHHHHHHLCLSVSLSFSLSRSPPPPPSPLASPKVTPRGK